MRFLPSLLVLLLFCSLTGCDAGGEPSYDLEDAFLFVEEPPEMLPSQQEGMALIQQRLVYPPEAMEAGIEGRVFVRFVVDQRGRVRSAEIARGICPACDEEALRVVRLARFRPGRTRGVPVPVLFSLPVTFRLR